MIYNIPLGSYCQVWGTGQFGAGEGVSPAVRTMTSQYDHFDASSPVVADQLQEAVEEAGEGVEP